jgi:hypothetical protein
VPDLDSTITTMVFVSFKPLRIRMLHAIVVALVLNIELLFILSKYYDRQVSATQAKQDFM